MVGCTAARPLVAELRGGVGWRRPLVPDLGPFGPHLGRVGPAASVSVVQPPGGGGGASGVWVVAALSAACCSVAAVALWARSGPAGLVCPCCRVRPATAMALEAVTSRAMAVEAVTSHAASVLPPPFPCAPIFHPLGLAMASKVRRRGGHQDRGGACWWVASWMEGS